MYIKIYDNYQSVGSVMASHYPSIVICVDPGFVQEREGGFGGGGGENDH